MGILANTAPTTGWSADQIAKDQAYLSNLKNEATAAALGVGQGITAGIGNPALAAVRSALPNGPTYQGALAGQTAALNQAQSNNPVAYGAGRLAGGATLAALGGEAAQTLGGARTLADLAGKIKSLANTPAKDMTPAQSEVWGALSQPAEYQAAYNSPTMPDSTYPTNPNYPLDPTTGEVGRYQPQGQGMPNTYYGGPGTQTYNQQFPQYMSARRTNIMAPPGGQLPEAFGGEPMFYNSGYGYVPPGGDLSEDVPYANPYTGPTYGPGNSIIPPQAADQYESGSNPWFSPIGSPGDRLLELIKKTK